MTLAWVIGGAAVLSAGTSLYEASQQQGISNQALGLAQNTQNEQMQYNNQLMNMLANPSSIFTNPAFTAATAVGEQGVAHQGAAAYGPNSTNEAAALQGYGQSAGLSFLTSQEQLLASLSGATNASSPTQALSTASGAQALSAQNLGSLFYGLGALGGQYGGGGNGAITGAGGGYSNLTSVGGYLADQTGLGAFAEGLMAGEAFKMKKQQVSQDQQLFQLSLQEGQMKVETDKFKLTELKRAVDMQNDVAKKLNLQMAKDQANPNYDPIAEMAKLGVISGQAKIERGFVNDGLEDIKAAQGLSDNQEKIKRLAWENASTKAQHTADLVSQVTSNDPKVAAKQWQDAILAWSGGGHDVDQQAYQKIGERIADPKFRAALMNSANSRKEQAELDYKKSQRAKEEVDIDMDKAHTKAYESQTRANDALADNRRKNDGGKSGDIKSKYVGDITTALKSAYPAQAAANADALKEAALPLAGEVQKKIRDGMSEDEAVASVVSRYKQDNPKAFRAGGGPMGQTPSKPLSYPSDPTKREVGLYYKGAAPGYPDAVYRLTKDGLKLVDDGEVVTDDGGT